ncbi:hypothetical protein OH779_28860 [Actinacidiphila glaucinigra]|uniref:VOC family protein n=1 Tax=Actinacidiphila glaucinigra TaxID=235986 RepID=UPI00386AA2AF
MHAGPRDARARSRRDPGSERVHLDLYADDAAEQAAEVERAVAPGAGRVDWDRCPPEPDLVVPADTEGNRLRVIDESFG